MPAGAPRVVAVTGDALRHRGFAHALAADAGLELVGVWYEAKEFDPAAEAGSAEDRRTIAEHFARRDSSEASYFQAAAAPLEGTLETTVARGGPNTGAELQRIAGLTPDLIAVFGSGILRRPFLEQHRGRILNLHLGLSPYYRGSGTNFWPLVNREPEYLGATIHYIDEGIDTGPIVAHVRPDMRADSGPHDIGNRVIVAAASVLARALAAHHRGGPLRAQPQRGGGRYYRRSDFTADAIRRMERNFTQGMIGEYLADRAARDEKLELVEISA